LVISKIDKNIELGPDATVLWGNEYGLMFL